MTGRSQRGWDHGARRRGSPAPLAWLALGLALSVAAGARAADAPASCAVAPSEPDEAASALDRGNTLAAQGRTDAALAAFSESGTRALEAHDATTALFADASAVRAEIDAGRAADASQKLAALLSAADDLDDPTARARVRIHLARSLALLGREPRAAEVFAMAADDARSAAEPRLESFALGYSAELYERRGRSGDARELAKRALLAAQVAEAPDALYRWHWLLGRLQQAAGDPDAAVEAYRRAVATLSGEPELGGPDTEGLYESLVDLLLRRAATRRGDERQRLLAEARNALEDYKAAELRDYFHDDCLDAKRKAAPDEVPGALVVYPIVLPDRTELVTSRGGVLTSHVVPVPREQLVDQVRALRRTLEKRTTRQYLRPARQLYEWLIRPLEPDLESDDVETLVFVPGGALRTVPFAALHDERSNQFLIEKIPIAITPGLTLTDPGPIDRSRVQVLAAGISESVQGYPGLVNVEEEIDTLADTFPARRLMNEEFVVSRFEDEVTERAFGIVHVASHGEFSSDVSQSYLLTYDGRISMDELAALVGTTRFRERGLELLTLSACETAAGDDRAALGLAGVALRAGARSALATIWSVNDEASARIVSEFYTRLSDPHVSRAQALQSAQLKVLNMYEFRHPSYWAPYLLISSWL